MTFVNQSKSIPTDFSRGSYLVLALSYAYYFPSRRPQLCKNIDERYLFTSSELPRLTARQLLDQLADQTGIFSLLLPVPGDTTGLPAQSKLMEQAPSIALGFYSKNSNEPHSCGTTRILIPHHQLSSAYWHLNSYSNTAVTPPLHDASLSDNALRQAISQATELLADFHQLVVDSHTAFRHQIDHHYQQLNSCPLPVPLAPRCEKLLDRANLIDAIITTVNNNLSVITVDRRQAVNLEHSIGQLARTTRLARLAAINTSLRALQPNPQHS